MIRRVLRYVLWVLAIALLAALGTWFWHRPATPATVEHAALEDGSAITLVTPASRVKTRIALAVNGKDKLSDKQLQALGTDAAASIIQVELPADDCVLQSKVFNAALQKLDGAPKVVGGIGHGATLAWRWLASQSDDKAQAISVGFALQHVSNPPPVLEEGDVPPQICDEPLPQKAPHGKWLAAFNDAPDDPSAAFVRDQPNAETSISDYDIPLSQVLNTGLRHALLGENDAGGLGVPTVEVHASQSSDTVTLFLSGDGGWRDLDKVVAGDMAKVGYPVVGIDVLRYFWERKSPEQIAADLTELMNHYRQKWGAKRFILAGYSFGADVLPAAFNRMAPEDQERIDGMILLALARSGNFEIHVDGWLGNAGTEAKTGPEVAKLPAAKVLCVYGAEEKKDSGCTDTTIVGEVLELPGGHHFDENYPALAKRLMRKIDQWQGKAAATVQ